MGLIAEGVPIKGQKRKLGSLGTASSSAAVGDAAESRMAKRATLPTSFCDEIWLKAMGPVRVSNALEYFARSPFCDLKSTPGKRHKNEFGIEYRVFETQHKSLIIVVKQFRSSKTVVRKLAVFYILDNRIFPAPHVHEIMLSRINKCCAHLLKAVRSISSIYLNSSIEGGSPTEHKKEATDGSTPSNAPATASSSSQANVPENTAQSKEQTPAQNGQTSSSSDAIESHLPHIPQKANFISKPYRMRRLEMQADSDIQSILRSLVNEFTTPTHAQSPAILAAYQQPMTITQSVLHFSTPAGGVTASPIVSNDTPALLTSPALLAPTITPKTSPPHNE